MNMNYNQLLKAASWTVYQNILSLIKVLKNKKKKEQECIQSKAHPPLRDRNSLSFDSGITLNSKYH